MILDPIIERLKELPSNFQTIVDVGTNTGNEIQYFKDYWPNARIITIEPNPIPFEELKKINGIEHYKLALGYRNGYFPFYPSLYRNGKLHTGSGSLRRPKDHLQENPDVKFGESFLVETLTMDSFCKKYGISSIDFLWMDVQGCEGDIVENSLIIKNNTNFIYTESYHNEMYEGQKIRHELLNILNNFSVVDLEDKYNILLKRMI